jgi:hypothetical protein
VAKQAISLLEGMQVLVDLIQSCETNEMRIEDDILLQRRMCNDHSSWSLSKIRETTPNMIMAVFVGGFSAGLRLAAIEKT